MSNDDVIHLPAPGLVGPLSSRAWATARQHAPAPAGVDGQRRRAAWPGAPATGAGRRHRPGHGTAATTPATPPHHRPAWHGHAPAHHHRPAARHRTPAATTTHNGIGQPARASHHHRLHRRHHHSSLRQHATPGRHAAPGRPPPNTPRRAASHRQRHRPYGSTGTGHIAATPRRAPAGHRHRAAGVGPATAHRLTPPAGFTGPRAWAGHLGIAWHASPPRHRGHHRHTAAPGLPPSPAGPGTRRLPASRVTGFAGNGQAAANQPGLFHWPHRLPLFAATSSLFQHFHCK